ncbi:MAG: PhzF family phenazine biosynthesis isomerase [Gammaproteobacteria bacterium]|nr:PhzF family phenazine biosynthesis isomerase [Gammaproteobacteria bacterium]
MSRRVRIFQVDAFAAQLFCGNPASVVLDAELLREPELAALAGELRGSDTAFVLPPDGADHDLRVRFFTPRAETAFVGHATIAVHAVRAALGLSACHRQKQRSGIVATGRLAGGPGARFYFSQPPPPLHGAFAGPQADAALVALGLAAADLDPQCPATIAGERGGRALVAVRDGSILARLRPDLARLAALSAEGCPPGYFVYTRVPALPDCDTEARMFCPAIGIDEDPVSGNAHALLAMHLHSLGLLPRRPRASALTDPGYISAGFTGRQGHHLGRPGFVGVQAQLAGERVASVQIEGSAVLAFESGIALD